MDDDNISKDEQPSASKKENQKTNPDDMENTRDDSQDSRLDSESTASSYVSVNSRVEAANARHKMPKPPIGKEPKPDRKKRVKPTGRVEKRTTVRRPIPRRAPKRRVKHRQERKKRDLSISTIFTRLSSGSVSPSIGCIYCGHRCCRRRFEYLARIRHRRMRVRRRVRRLRRPKLKVVASVLRGSECVQAGSRCIMLSSLYLGSNATPEQKPIEEPLLYCGVTPEMIHESVRSLTMWRQDVTTISILDYMKVTPEMIHESVRSLTMWRQDVTTISILDYMKRNYPVCQDIPQLFEELAEKLRIASMVGIVTRTAAGNWCLNCAMKNRKLMKNHVTLFWDVYADTLKPVTKKAMMDIASIERMERETNTAGRPVNIVMDRETNDIT